MKTAEEWRGSITFQSGLSEGNIDKGALLRLIKQIQLDAMKEGMRRAAEVTLTVSAVPVSRKLIKDEMKEAILTAAEQLTEKDI